MTVYFASVIVPQPQASEYLEYLETSAIPTYESAAGLISVYLLQRSFVAYTELLTFTIWESDQALRQFVESQPLRGAFTSQRGVIQFEPRAYQLVVSRRGKFGSAVDLQQE